MKFKATRDDIAKLLATATNASIPAGTGLLIALTTFGKTYTAEDFVGVRSADYIGGRMVKLYPREIEPDVWEIGEPQFVAGDMERTYQSWGGTYPTAKALIEAAGLTALDDAHADGEAVP